MERSIKKRISKLKKAMRILLSNNNNIYTVPNMQQLQLTEVLCRQSSHLNMDTIILSSTNINCICLVINTIKVSRTDTTVSKINTKQNLGNNILYSYTMITAIVGCYIGYSWLYVSLNGTQHFITATILIINNWFSYTEGLGPW